LVTPWAERGVDGIVGRRPLPLDACSGHAGPVAASLQSQRRRPRRVASQNCC